MEKVHDRLRFHSVWKLFKWKDPTGKIASYLQGGGRIENCIMAFGKPYAVETIDGNLGLNEGITTLLQLLVASNPTQTSFSGGTAYLGVGDSAGTAVATQTGLLATSNKLYKAIDSGYPTVVNQTVTWQSTFASADANFAWNEYTVANGNSDAAMNLNRMVTAKGTKASGETWILQLSITIS
jgi:hypothetical protein